MAATPSDESGPEPLSERVGRVVGVALGVVIVLAFVVGSVWTAIKLVPADLPQKPNPNFVDNIFQSRIMIGAARILLLALGTYVAASIAAHLFAQRWLFEAGPVKVAKAVERTTEAASDLESVVDALNEQIVISAELEEKVEERDEIIGALLDRLEDGDHLEEADGPTDTTS